MSKKGLLATEFCGIAFKNPIVVASSDIGRSAEAVERYAKTGVGGIITKSVTDAASLQNKGITMFDIRDMDGHSIAGTGMIPKNYSFFSRGGSMIAMECFEAEAREILKTAKRYQVVPIASVCAGKIENWVDYSRQFEAMGYPMLELNLGNPHGEAAKGKLGFQISQETDLCVEVASCVIQAVKIPVVVKLTPQLSDLTRLARALKAAGVRAVTIQHRFQGLVIDHSTMEPVIGGYAAIGGPWMKPLSLANVAKVYKATGLEIMGGNGADDAQDVLDFILSGAPLVQIASSMMLKGPDYAASLTAELEALVEKTGKGLKELLGLAADRIVPYTELGRIPARCAEIDTRLCKGCVERPCVSHCFNGAIRTDGNSISHDSGSCSGCGMCRHVCPRSAVQIIDLQN